MQTFLPFESFEESAAVLDRMRLGKQRVETFQILQRLIGNRLVTKNASGEELEWMAWYLEPLAPGGWSNHPAARMWRGHEASLLAYQDAICAEWTGRGYRDTCKLKSQVLFGLCGAPAQLGFPGWLGDEDFHRSHRSNLLRKDPLHYGNAFEPDLSPDLEYVWPTP